MSKKSALQVFNGEGNKLTCLFDLKESTQWIVVSNTDVNITLRLMVDQTEDSTSAQNTPSHQRLYLILSHSSGFTHKLPSVSLFSPMLRSFPISHPAERVELPSHQYGEILYVLANIFTSHLRLIPALLTMSDFLSPALPVVRHKRIFVSWETQLDLMWLRMLGPQINALRGAFFKSIRKVQSFRRYIQMKGLFKLKFNSFIEKNTSHSHQPCR